MMKTTALLAACVVLFSLSAVTADTTQKQVIRNLKNCGSEAKNDFGAHTEYPAINEGNGYVGFKTEDSDAKGTKERYSLVNCEARSLVRADAEYNLADSQSNIGMGGDLFSFVDGLRKKQRLANDTLFARLAKESGYAVTKGKLPEPYTKASRRSDCGCSLYYPELLPQGLE